jgi:PKD repeat protein
MKKLAALLLGTVLSLGGRNAAAQEPVERIVHDDCYIDYWTEAPQLWCHIVVAAPDLSNRVLVAEGIDPSVSPDGSRIAFDGGPQRDDIVVLTLADGSLTNLTNDPARDASPAWSPDGSKIAFESDRAGGNELFVMNADGSAVTQLTHDVGFGGRPAWSPDGARILFTCQVATGNSDICSIAADGTDLVRLTDDPAFDFGAAFSADGSRIAFATTRYASSYGLVDIAIMNPDGSSVSRLGDGVYGVWPAWSEDGTRLALAAPAGACEQDGRLCYDTLHVVTADGADLGFGASGSNPSFARLVMTPRPFARFKATCVPLACTFDASPSWDLGATITSYTWDFGDGATASGATPSHTFASPGSYRVSVTVADETGATDTQTQVVEVAANVPPVASFTAACTDLTCVFDGGGSYDVDGGITSFQWDFGDGGTASSVGTSYYHAFASPGNFTVTLTVTDDLGAVGAQSRVIRVGNAPPVASFTATCSGFTCSFDATASADPDGTIAGYSWSFGDGAIGSGATATHAYGAGQYSVVLTVTDNGGATGATSHLVTAVNASPVASFTVSCSALACTFDGSASSDSDGTIVAYGWNFGDGTVAPGPTATHSYSAAGSFTVILTVTDNGGMSGTRIRVVSVDTPPVASFTASCVGLTCSFNASASSDPDGTVAGYSWAFGDGATGSGVSPSHAYATAANFTVTLTVTDNLGATGSQARVVTTTNTPPVGSFTASCIGLTCSFNASASSDADGTIAGYGWAFGDGTTGSGASPSHAYAAAGNFTVTLTVTDNGGASGTQTVTVSPTQAHVGDLDGRASSQGGTWTAAVTITVHTSSHGLAAGATVIGAWTGGATSSCTSDSSGQCLVSRPAIPGGTRSVTFTVTGVTHASMTYRAADNHDPDGDSNGTSITVNKH